MVDNYASARLIRAGAQRVDCPDSVRPWLSTAATLAETAIGATLGPRTDPVKVRLDALERTRAAAHAAGPVEVKGVEPP